jgi:hypothetical protein
VKAAVQRRHIIRHFLNVVEGDAGRLVVLKEVQVGQRRLPPAALVDRAGVAAARTP